MWVKHYGGIKSAIYFFHLDDYKIIRLMYVSFPSDSKLKPEVWANRWEVRILNEACQATDIAFHEDDFDVAKLKGLIAAKEWGWDISSDYLVL